MVQSTYMTQFEIEGRCGGHGVTLYDNLENIGGQT